MLRKGTNKHPKGSLKWIRETVNKNRQLLDREIKACFDFPDRERFEWVSPLARDEYV